MYFEHASSKRKMKVKRKISQEYLNYNCNSSTSIIFRGVLYTLGQYLPCFGHRSKNKKLGTRTRQQSFLPIFCQQVNYFGDIRDTLKIFIQFHTLLASALVSDAISLITLSDCTIKTYFTLFDLKQTLAHKQSFSPCQ